MAINEIIASVWESILFLGFMGCFHGAKHLGKRKIEAFVLAAILLIANIFIADLQSSYEPWVIIGDFLIVMSYSRLELQGKWLTHIAAFILYYAGLFGRTSLAVLLMELVGRNGILSWTNTDDAYRGLFLLLAGILLLLYVLLILKLKKHIIFVIKKWSVLINVLIPIGIFVLLFYLVDIVMHESISQRGKVSILLMVIILLIALFCFAANGMKSEIQKQKNMDLVKLVKAEKEAYERLYESREEMIRFKHDIINKMLAIKYLLDGDRNQQAGSEIEQVIEDVSGEKRTFTKSKYLWDLIIDSRARDTEEANIRIERDIYPGNYQGIHEIDLALIIGNLFDNAVEAQDKVARESRHIVFHMKETWGCVYIEMQNSAKIETHFVLKGTTKEDKVFHGWGLRNVQEVVKKYSGKMVTNVLEKEFVVKIMLYTE